MSAVTPAHIKSTSQNHFQLQADSPAAMAATNEGPNTPTWYRIPRRTGLVPK